VNRDLLRAARNQSFGHYHSSLRKYVSSSEMHGKQTFAADEATAQSMPRLGMVCENCTDMQLEWSLAPKYRRKR
jgi:hypothetical protein